MRTFISLVVLESHFWSICEPLAAPLYPLGVDGGEGHKEGHDAAQDAAHQDGEPVQLGLGVLPSHLGLKSEVLYSLIHSTQTCCFRTIF